MEDIQQQTKCHAGKVQDYCEKRRRFLVGYR